MQTGEDKMQRPFRVSFDRSALHGDWFKKLRVSRLESMVESKKLEVYYTHIFIEGTLRTLATAKAQLEDEWTFLVRLNNLRWFAQPEDIINAEIDATTEGAYYLLSHHSVMKVLDVMFDFLNGKRRLSELDAAVEATSRFKGELGNLRSNILKLRQERDFNPGDCEEFFDVNKETNLREFILNNREDTELMVERWRQSPQDFPFMQSYLRSMLSVPFLGIADKSARVDTNDKTDAMQLACVVCLDVFVSNDRRFKKRAFDLPYHDTEKKLLTTNEFLDWLGCVENETKK